MNNLNVIEQKNYYDLLRKTIESDLIQNNLLSKYITVDGVLDIAKIKNESEEYRKQLVLAQSMVHSLKSDVEELTTENENLKKNLEKFNNNSNYNNIINKFNNEKSNLENSMTLLKLENDKLKKDISNYEKKNK